MSLQTIEAALAAAAKAEWAKIKAEAIVIEQEIVPEIETVFENLSIQLAPTIMSIISNLATGGLAKLSGDEKTNLAATTLVEQAGQQGIAILAADATGIVKNGFEAFKKAAPDLGLPQNVVDAANTAIDAGESAVTGAIAGGAATASSKI